MIKIEGVKRTPALAGILLCKVNKSKAEKMNPKHYSMFIQWDDKDNVYVISVPELKIRIYGKTYEEAIQNAVEIVELWLEVASQDGRLIPPPQTL